MLCCFSDTMTPHIAFWLSPEFLGSLVLVMGVRSLRFLGLFGPGMTMAAMCRPGMMGMVMTTSTPTSFSSAPNCNALPVFRPCAGLRIDLRNGRSQNHRNEFLQQRTRSSGGQRRRNSRSVVRAGLPVVSSIPVVGPLANAIFNPVLLVIVYAAGGKTLSITLQWVFVHLKQF